MENMLHQDGHRDVIPGIQDGYSLAISDYLGADICPTIQADLQGGIHLHGPEVRVIALSLYSVLHKPRNGFIPFS